MTITYHAGRRIQGTSGDATGNTNTTQTYTSGATADSDVGGIYFVGEGANTTSSVFYNGYIKSVNFYAFNPSSNSGTCHAVQMDENGQVVHTFWSKDMSTLGTSNGTMTTETSIPSTVQFGQYHSLGMWSTANMKMGINLSGTFDGTDTTRINYTNFNGASATRDVSTGYDMAFNVVVGTKSNEISELTNVQAGSRFEETDTLKMYHYESGSAIETLDSTNGTTGWNVDSGGSDITIDTGNNEIDITGSSLKSGYYDLGTSASVSSWLLRFKITSSGSQSSNPLYWIGLFDTQYIVSNSTNVDGISLMAYSGSNYNLSMKNGNTMDSGGSQTNTSPTVSADTTTRYVEIVRNGSNAILTFYDSDTYTTSIGTCTVAITGTSFQYLCAVSYNQGSGRTYSLSDVKFYNGTTTTVMPVEWKEEGT